MSWRFIGVAVGMTLGGGLALVHRGHAATAYLLKGYERDYAALRLERDEMRAAIVAHQREIADLKLKLQPPGSKPL